MRRNDGEPVNFQMQNGKFLSSGRGIYLESFIDGVGDCVDSLVGGYLGIANSASESDLETDNFQSR